MSIYADEAVPLPKPIQIRSDYIKIYDPGDCQHCGGRNPTAYGAPCRICRQWETTTPTVETQAVGAMRFFHFHGGPSNRMQGPHRVF